MGDMPLKPAKALAGILALSCLLACSPRARATTGSRLIGTWGVQENGMKWEWVFAENGSAAWKIAGLTDMGGKPVEIGGKGSYIFDGAVLLLTLERFAGVPGMLRSAEAPPGFDPSTKVAVHFAGNEGMTWSFSTASLGAQEFKVSRLR